MAKLDERVAEIHGFTIFKKSESSEYELVGPAAPNSPLAYTVIRITPSVLEKLNQVVKDHAKV
jgi:hypothetical protein